MSPAAFPSVNSSSPGKSRQPFFKNDIALVFRRPGPLYSFLVGHASASLFLGSSCQNTATYIFNARTYFLVDGSLLACSRTAVSSMQCSPNLPTIDISPLLRRLPSEIPGSWSSPTAGYTLPGLISQIQVGTLHLHGKAWSSLSKHAWLLLCPSDSHHKEQGLRARMAVLHDDRRSNSSTAASHHEPLTKVPSE